MSPTAAVVDKHNASTAKWKEAPGEGRAARGDLDAGFGSSVIAPKSERPERKVFIKLAIQARLSDLPGKWFLLRYLTHLYRHNRRPNTLELNFTGIRLFLEFIQREGLCRLEEIPTGEPGRFH